MINDRLTVPLWLTLKLPQGEYEKEPKVTEEGVVGKIIIPQSYLCPNPQNLGICHLFLAKGAL